MQPGPLCVLLMIQGDEPTTMGSRTHSAVLDQTVFDYREGNYREILRIKCFDVTIVSL